jgi:hypothetical protein
MGEGELATEALQVVRTLLWAPSFRRAKDCPPCLLAADSAHPMRPGLALATCTQWPRWMGARNMVSRTFELQKSNAGLQNCVTRWRSCVHTVVDAANLPRVTRDDWMETKLTACAALRVEAGEGSASSRGKKCSECAANYTDCAINSRQLLSISFCDRFSE